MPNKELVEYLMGFITPERQALFNKIVAQRTRHLTVVLEDIYSPHNASAVIRSCDCFGVQDVHVIENLNEWHYSPEVEMGSSKWITVNRFKEPDHKNTERCLTSLKNKGYRIVATSPRAEVDSLEKLDISKPVALVFGTEKTGVSEVVDNMCDEKVCIPMYGFTESFNISVSAALVLFNLRQRLEKLLGGAPLNEEDQCALLAEWCKKTINGGDAIARNFLAKS